MRLTENWRTTLDKNIFTGAVLTNLSKAFEYIPHNLLIAKLHEFRQGNFLQFVPKKSEINNNKQHL